MILVGLVAFCTGVVVALGGAWWDRRHDRTVDLEAVLRERLAGMFGVEHDEPAEPVEAAQPPSPLPDPVAVGIMQILADTRAERAGLVQTMAEITRQAQEQAVRVVEAFGRAVGQANGYDQPGRVNLDQELLTDPVLHEILWPTNETDAAEEQSWASIPAEPAVGLPRWDDLGVDPPAGELPGEGL